MQFFLGPLLALRLHDQFQVDLPNTMICTLKSKEPTQTFVPKIFVSWYLGIRNGSIARGFWNLNQSIEQKIKNLKLEKCRYITDIKIMFWDTAQYLTDPV